jgi:hypothetical protein
MDHGLETVAGDPHDNPVAALVAGIAEEAAAQRRRPPHAQRQSRAGYGATLLSGCYTTLGVWGPLARGPVDPVFHYAWWISAALGAYWLLAGLFGRARGPLVGGLGLVIEAAIAGWLLWNRMYPAALPYAAFLLHGVYVAMLCGVAAQFLSALLALRRDDALVLVNEDIEENDFDWERM